MKKRSKKTLIKELVEINRNFIGGISLKDLVYEDKLTPSEKLKYLQDAELVYNNIVFQNELKRIIQTQLEFMGMEAIGMEQIYVSRGTMNGMDLLTERFLTLHNEYKEATKPEDTNFDEFNPLAEG